MDHFGSPSPTYSGSASGVRWASSSAEAPTVFPFSKSGKREGENDFVITQFRPSRDGGRSGSKLRLSIFSTRTGQFLVPGSRTRSTCPTHQNLTLDGSSIYTQVMNLTGWTDWVGRVIRPVDNLRTNKEGQPSAKNGTRSGARLHCIQG